MVEPEIAFADLDDCINLAEDYLTHCVNYALTHCQKDLSFLRGKTPLNEEGLQEKLQSLVKNPFARLTYTEAIHLLEKAFTESHVEFELKPTWGIDLATEHERYLCETIFQKPVILTNYPMDVKAFYMKLDATVFW
jgi:asparaginyl-tRNA synthetase